MSNAIEFFQSVQTQLAVPAANVSVLLDGILCPDLEVQEIVRAGWPEFGWAKLTYNPAAQQGADVIDAEQIESRFAMGKSVCIRQYYNGVPPGSATFSIPVFIGQIEGIEKDVNQNGAKVEIIARDLSANLKRVTVYGRRIKNSDGSTVFLTGLDTIFNPDGEPNADDTPAQVAGKTYTTFCAEQTQSKFFSCAEAIDYLLSEYLPHGQLQRPGIEQLKSLTNNQVLRDLDVTGLNLLEALYHCCERTGLKFKFVPQSAPTGPAQAIVFYRIGSGRCVELNCQKAGERLSVSKTDIATLRSRRNFYPVTHRYIGHGDFKIYEASFELIKAWDPALEDTDYYKFSPSTNSEFYKVKDVYRKWCLNEAGDYTVSPFNQGQAFDFSKIFSTSNFARKRRRFWPALSADKQGKSLGYFLQVSYDGVHWWQYLYAFNNLLDECGIWLSSDQLDVDTWVAALKKVLRFRITTSVISDERLRCAVADGPVDSSAPVVEHLVTLPRQFKLRKVASQSIFAGPADEALGEPDEVNDSTALDQYVRQIAATSAHTIDTVDLRTPILTLHNQVGDIVTTSPESSDLLGCRRDNRSKSWIERVQMDFKQQCTNLKIVRQRL
jgi:hypothetical protein